MKRWLRYTWSSERAPFIALVCVAVLIGIGLLMAMVNEDAYREQKTSELATQAQIMAASVAPALAFDNSANAEEYLAALGANPMIEAAAAYDLAGTRVAMFSRENSAAPPAHVTQTPAHFEAQSIVVVAPVVRAGQAYGAVYLREAAEPPLRRYAHYGGVAILLLLAAVVLTMFGLSQGTIAHANAALSAANEELSMRAQQLQHEIEQRERAEEELLQSRKLEAVGQLTGGVAHDFNNLLTVVLSGLRLIERNPDPARRAATIEAMRQAIERGAGLTRQMLAFGRRQTLTLQPVDIRLHLKGMRELLERSLRADIIVDIVTPDDLWPVTTDPTQFELAILNLAVNARDAMPKGGVLTIAARNSAQAEGDFVEIEVRDTGVGMPPETLQRVFEPYFTTKQAGQGTGLGLAQVYGIVKQSGGGARVESEVNAGTRVILSLPRSAEAPKPEQPAQTQQALVSTQGKRVLVVEDDDAVAAMVTAMLEQMGFASTRVANAQDALRALERGGEGYDLVFSDIVMPGPMNGVDLARAVEQRYPRLPILLATGYSGSADVSVDFPLIRKPYQMEELEQRMSEALTRAPASNAAS